jgi:hypothetical protein
LFSSLSAKQRPVFCCATQRTKLFCDENKQTNKQTNLNSINCEWIVNCNLSIVLIKLWTVLIKFSVVISLESIVEHDRKKVRPKIGNLGSQNDWKCQVSTSNWPPDFTFDGKNR